MDIATIKEKTRTVNERDRLEVTRRLAPGEEVVRNMVYYKGIERIPELPALTELVVYTELNETNEGNSKTDRYDIGTVREIVTF